MKPNILCFDLETTGLGERGERVVPVQLAAIVLDPDFQELGRFHTFLQIPADAHLEDDAMEMHARKGRTYDWYQAYGRPAQLAWLDFAAFCKPFGRLLPAGHNVASFDKPILVRELLRHGIAVSARSAEPQQIHVDLDYHVLDTAALAYAKLVFQQEAISRVSLRPLCEHLGIALSEEDAHDAMHDVLATVEVLRELLARL